MKFVLKREYFNYYIDNFLNNLCSHSFTNSLASVELNREPLILALNPFLSSYLEGLISQSISSLSYDRSYYVKYENVSNQHYIQFKENDDQMKEDIDNLISYLSTQSQMLLSYNQDTVIDAEVDRNMLMLGDKYYSMDHFISVDSDVIDVKIFTDKSDVIDLKKHNPQMKNIKFADFNSGWGGLGNATVPKEAYFVLFKNNMVIGLSMLRDSNEVEGAMSSHFTSIIEEEQGKGYSNLILEKKIEYLKSINKSLHNSLYTTPGFNCLRSKTIKLCEQNGVDLFENGLLGVADSFDQEVFKIQNELKKTIQSAKLNNRDLLSTKNGRIDPSLYKSIIIEFLKINIHNVDKKDWQNIANRYSMFFDEYSLELLKKIKT